jgi:hypothetical protein
MVMEREARTRQQLIALYEDKKIGFLRGAVEQGADQIVPEHVTPEQWERQKDIGKAYSHLASMTGEALGEIYGLTRGRISQIHNKYIISLHRNLLKISPEFASKFPSAEEIILVKKPFAELRPTSIVFQVKQQVNQGVNSRAQIVENTGFTPDQVHRAAYTLKRHNIATPRDINSFIELQEQFAKEEDNEKLQDMLNMLKPGSIRGMINYHRGQETFFSSLTNILIEEGLHVRYKELKSIVALLRSKKIPIIQVSMTYKTKKGKETHGSYVIVLTKRRQQILEVLVENPDIFARLSDDPVKIIYGPQPERTPNTTEISREGNIGRLIFERFGLQISPRKSRYVDILSDSPVSIFKAGGKYWYLLAQEEALAKFLEGRLRGLGII